MHRVFIVYSLCFTVFSLFCHCVFTVLVFSLCGPCVFTVLSLYFHCVVPVSSLCYHCIFTVLSLCATWFFPVCSLCFPCMFPVCFLCTDPYRCINKQILTASYRFTQIRTYSHKLVQIHVVFVQIHIIDWYLFTDTYRHT